MISRRVRAIRAALVGMKGGAVLVRFAHGVETTDGLDVIGVDGHGVRWL